MRWKIHFLPAVLSLLVVALFLTMVSRPEPGPGDPIVKEENAAREHHPENSNTPERETSSAPEMAGKTDPSPSAQAPSDETKPAIQVVQSSSEERTQWKGRSKAAINGHQVILSPRALDGRPFEKNDNLSFDLPDGRNIQATVRESFVNVNQTVSTTALVEGSDWGRVFLASSDGKLLARIRIPEENRIFSIEYNLKDNSHYALELDPILAEPPDSYLPIPVMLADPMGGSDLYAEAEIEPAPPIVNAPTIIDVMFVYSNDALSQAGSVSEMNRRIATAISMGNDALTNTNTGIEMVLVHSYNVSYNGSGDLGTDLSRMGNPSDGYMDDIFSQRDTHGADFVQLASGSGGGIAWLLTSNQGNANLFCSVVGGNSITSYTSVHEFGHNWGLHHARDQNFQPGPTGGSIGDDAAGWHWHPTPGAYGYCSVMSYSGGSYFPDGLSHSRVGLFSDPNIYDHGVPAGHSQYANNARVLRDMKGILAGYRNSTTPPPPPPPSATVTGFTLMDSANGTDIGAINDNATINLQNTGKSLNIRASVSGTPGAVNFTLSGAMNHTKTENYAPYCLFGDVYSWNPPIGDYTLTANCDGSGSKTVRFQVISGTTPPPPPPGGTTVAINCGGPAFTASDGISYRADTYFNTGNTYSTGDAIVQTTDDVLYQSERWGNYRYDIPVDNGTYLVTLKMAEIYFYATNRRVFSVKGEGTTLLPNIDLYSVAGHDTAYNRTFTVNVNDGRLTLDFSASVNNAKCSAILVRPQEETVAINCGGPAFTGSDGTNYQADAYFNAGNTYSTGDAIASTSDDLLYKSERYGDYRYDIPLANGTYDVTLKMAEIYWNGSGRRIFSVKAEGTTRLSNLDLYSLAGHDNAYNRTFSVTVNDGRLTLDFIRNVDNAKCGAIVIRRQ